MPLSDVEFGQLASDLESDRIERKAALSDTDRVAQAICAFANDLPGHRQPGYVLIGVDDKSGDPVGLDVDDALLLKLASLRDNGSIIPIPSISVSRHMLRGHAVAVVKVQPSLLPPVRFKGRVWIRVGPRRAHATPEEEQRLSERRLAHDLPFDSRPVPSASIDDLDLDQFRRTYLPSAVDATTIAENHRTVEQQLAALKLTTSEGIPTAAGLLAVGLEPSAFIPGAYVQYLRVRGTDLSSDIVTERAIHGPLTTVIRETENLLTANIDVAVDITTESVERRQPTYPLVALQQLFRNALMHRTYEASNAPTRVTQLSDRIEIANPGGPFGQVTIESFGRPGVTDYRNPTVAEVLKTLGFVQRFGVGIQTAQRAAADNGNPELRFDVDSTFVSVVVRAR